MLTVTKLSENATVPTKRSKKSAGVTLYSSEDITIASFEKRRVHTDISVKIPYGAYGKIASTPNQAADCIDVVSEIIDRDYRENITVTIFNADDTPFQIKKGDEIGQLICVKVIYPKIRTDKCTGTDSKAENVRLQTSV